MNFFKIYHNRGHFNCFFFQAEDGIRDQPRSRGLGDVYKRQLLMLLFTCTSEITLFSSKAIEVFLN